MREIGQKLKIWASVPLRQVASTLIPHLLMLEAVGRESADSFITKERMFLGNALAMDCQVTDYCFSINSLTNSP